MVKEENEEEEASTPAAAADLAPSEEVVPVPVPATADEEEDRDEMNDFVDELSNSQSITGEVAPVKAIVQQHSEEMVRASIAGVKSLFLKKVEVSAPGIIQNLEIFGALEKTERQTEIKRI